MKLFLRKKWVLFLAIVGIPFLSSAQDNQWSQYRGAERAGSSSEKLFVEEWNESSLNPLWKVHTGSGFSEVLVSGELIYTMVSETIDSTTGSEFLACFDEDSGNERWRVRVDSLYFDPDGWGDGTRATPVLESGKIYCFSAYGKLSAHEAKDGKIIWQNDIAALYGSTEPRWGFTSAPLILNDLLIMEAGGKDNHAFMAFDKETGAVIWNYGNGNASFNSPLLTHLDGQEQIVFANGRTLYSFHPNGDTLWTYTLPFSNIITMPLKVDENKIFLSGIRTPGFVMVEINENQPKEVLRGNSMKTDFNTSVYHDGYIYGFHVAALRCISAETGEVKWTKRGYGKGSLILVDGHLMVLSDQGKLIVVEANPESFVEKSSLQAIEGKSWTAPSFVNGKLYLRNLSEMTCIEIQK
jgi:outer membrane protein assembly factor BamB